MSNDKKKEEPVTNQELLKKIAHNTEEIRNGVAFISIILLLVAAAGAIYIFFTTFKF
jgi:hypothetical protein